MGKHTLFYSTRCRFCQAFLEELSSTPYVSEIQLVCVDPSPSRPALPTWLKSVPSLLVQGESSPRVGPGSVNNWLFERKLGTPTNVRSPQQQQQQAFQERSAPMSLPTYSATDIAPRPDTSTRNTGSSRNSGMSPPTNAPPSSEVVGEPMAYHGSEMGSGKWSDNYSFVGGDPFSSEKGYNPIERNFESLIPTNALSGAKATSAPPVKRSMKEEALLNEFQAYTAARDRDVTGPVRRQ